MIAVWLRTVALCSAASLVFMAFAGPKAISDWSNATAVVFVVMYAAFGFFARCATGRWEHGLLVVPCSAAVQGLAGPAFTGALSGKPVTIDPPWALISMMFFVSASAVPGALGVLAASLAFRARLLR